MQFLIVDFGGGGLQIYLALCGIVIAHLVKSWINHD